MSFSFEFMAKKEDVSVFLDNEAANQWNPSYVIEFVRKAVEKVNCDIVHVKAHGHLHNGSDYDVSTVNIEVKPIRLTQKP